ncbi:MAG TPA: hypothetical protein VM054_04835 [bacterium]|nr:hypothetical protein [bacterium]
MVKPTSTTWILVIHVLLAVVGILFVVSSITNLFEPGWNNFLFAFGVSLMSATLISGTFRVTMPDTYIEIKKQLAIANKLIRSSQKTGLIAIWNERDNDESNLLWKTMFKNANSQIDLMAYAMHHLSFQPWFIEILNEKIAKMVQIRILLGNPIVIEDEFDFIKSRNNEEGKVGSIKERIVTMLEQLEPLYVPRNNKFYVKLHNTTLYNSIYRFDDNMLITPHLYGMVGSSAPLLHIIKNNENSLFEKYTKCFEAVWNLDNTVSFADYINKKRNL